ncbi:hypothetical protein BGZ96_000163 [Linnemannia gamsii]|uniref:G-protein coupled receptors family 3 profile domain-containing protein n=1 Tax=Linnemannia gamsii TaxID=64522 RepID=A0ABQ7KBI0_9FUNG|nr:hypothetical protein BGZ96_000163 [Linnemannia gamsii]
MWNPDPKTLRLGVLLNLNVPSTQREATMVRKAISTIRMAVNDINEEQIIPGLNMSIVIRDSQDPSFYTRTGGPAAISGAVKLIRTKVGGVIGDINSDLTTYEALMTSSVQIPQCSFASGSTTLSDQADYPFFYRTIPTIIVLLDALLDVIKNMGWTRISLIYDINSLGWAGREYFSSRAQNMGIYILTYQPLSTAGVPFDPTYASIKDQIRKSQSRIQVLLAAGTNQSDFLHEMKEAGFFGPDYAWVTTHDIAPQLRRDQDVKAYDGLIMVANGWRLLGYPPYDDFLSKWMRLNPLEYPGAGDPNLENNEGMAYSCVMMLAHAYRELIEQAIPNPADRSAQAPLVQEIIAGNRAADVNVSKVYKQKAYRGPSGPITLNQNGDREEGYFVAFSMQNGYSVQFGIVFTGNFTFTGVPFFKEHYTEFPSDAPSWTIENPRWDNASGIIIGSLCIIGVALTIISAMLVVSFRNNIVIKASSPTFCLCELLGILLVLIWCMLHIGIPRKDICIAQIFVLPIGVTLLTGSLTIKNYRVYRIFNSVTMVNQAFQTRLLLRWMALTLLICLVPAIVEVIIDAPVPKMINIQYLQWVRCCPAMSQVWWTIALLIIPAIMILFGVFLAFKTRNVVFLWNEAKQISLVLYNIFFFTVIIVVSQFFPLEMYLATFYISLFGTYFVALLSLALLFLPKFWNIWKNLRKPWADGLHPSNHNPRRRSGGIGRHGSGGDGGGGTGVLGQMPDDFRTAPTFARRQLGSATTTAAVSGMGMGRGVGIENDDGGHLRQPFKADTITTDSTLTPAMVPTAPNDGETSQKPPEHRRTFSVVSMHPGGGEAATAQLDGNPLGAWVSSRIWQQGSDTSAEEEMIGTFMRHRRASGLEDVEDGDGGTAGNPGENDEMNEHVDGGSAGGTESSYDRRLRISQALISVDIPREHNTHNRVEFAGSSVGLGGGGGTDVVLQEPLRSNAWAERTFGSSTSGAQCMLDCFVVRTHSIFRSRITSLLSHWCMVTVILIPEAHAFLAVDSTDGRSTSYLMLSMKQVQDEMEPTIRVTTCHAGAVLIRFSSQSRLDGWMKLFTEQDLQSLAARSSSTSSSESYAQYTSRHSGNVSGANGDASGMRRRSVAPDPSLDFIRMQSLSFLDPLSGNGGAGGGDHSDMAMTMNGDDPSGHGGRDRGNGLLASDDESQSWASRIGAGVSRLWHQKESSKSTSGVSSQTAYDSYNHHVYHHGHMHDHNNNNGGEVDEVGLASSRCSRAGRERASTDSNISNSGSVGRQSGMPMKYLSPFGRASEAAVEDREGETESPERGRQAAATTPQIEVTSLEERAPTNEVNMAGAGNSAIGFEGSNQSLRRGSTASGLVGDSLPPPALNFGSPPRPTSVHAPSLHSHQGSIHSVTRSEAQKQLTTEDDDEDSDDLYDPEFGIGGNGRRRRNRRSPPSRLLMTQGTPAAIPSAAVISAAAAAVSAGWSESDALAMAMACPVLSPTAPGSAGGLGLTPTAPMMSSNSASPRINRARHGSRASTMSVFRTNRNTRQRSVGGGETRYLSGGSSNNSNSVSLNQEILAARGSVGSILANSGGGGDTKRVFNDRINISPVSPTSGSSDKRLDASGQVLLSTSLNSPSSSSPIARASSVSSVVAPLATYSTNVDTMANSPIEPQLQPQ